MKYERLVLFHFHRLIDRRRVRDEAILEPPPDEIRRCSSHHAAAGEPGRSMESTLSTVLFFVAMLGGPLVAALLTLSMGRRATWQLLLAAYLGEVLCAETFRMWHLARLREWLASGQLSILTNRHSPSLPLRLLSDLLPALVVGGIVSGVSHRLWGRLGLGHRAGIGPRCPSADDSLTPERFDPD